MIDLVLAAALTLGINAVPAAHGAKEGQSQTAKLLTGLATKQPVKLVTLDLAVPDSPAFAILGLSPEKIARPGVPRELATTLLNGVDRRGNLQSGIAMDFAPLFLFAGNGLTYQEYQERHRHQAAGTDSGLGRDGQRSRRGRQGGARGDRRPNDVVGCGRPSPRRDPGCVFEQYPRDSAGRRTARPGGDRRVDRQDKGRTTSAGRAVPPAVQGAATERFEFRRRRSPGMAQPLR